MNLEQRFKEETGFDAYADNDLRPKVPSDYYVEWLEEQLNIHGAMPRTFTKETLKKAYIQGYRKRAINSELTYDKISEQYAIAEFENWFKNY